MMITMKFQSEFSEVCGIFRWLAKSVVMAVKMAVYTHGGLGVFLSMLMYIIHTSDCC